MMQPTSLNALIGEEKEMELDYYLRDPMKTKENITRFTLDSANRDKLDLLDGYGLGLDRIKDTNGIKKLIYTKDYYK